MSYSGTGMAADQVQNSSTYKRGSDQLRLAPPRKTASPVLGCANDDVASRLRIVILTFVQHLQGCIWITVPLEYSPTPH